MSIRDTPERMLWCRVWGFARARKGRPGASKDRCIPAGRVGASLTYYCRGVILKASVFNIYLLPHEPVWLSRAGGTPDNYSFEQAHERNSVS